jgi:hypothetical protein
MSILVKGGISSARLERHVDIVEVSCSNQLYPNEISPIPTAKLCDAPCGGIISRIIP